VVTNATSVPAPLGWCSWCLGDRQEEHQAVTLFNGAALCRSCNEAANKHANETAQENAEMLERSQRETEEMWRRLGRPGF
jgi:accessory colonization factor AcfC